MREIKGNIKGIRDSVIAELHKLYDMQSPQLVSQELAVKLADITEYINREISVYITRQGNFRLYYTQRPDYRNCSRRQCYCGIAFFQRQAWSRTP